MYASLRADFPALDIFWRTSNDDQRYNCHAWAADDALNWWEPIDPILARLIPGVNVYWPAGVPRGGSVAEYEAAFATEQFQPCADGNSETGFEKIAIYGNGAVARHTARQLQLGRWTSKLGPLIDISHVAPDHLEGPAYGQVASYMKRPAASTNVYSTGTEFRWDDAQRQYIEV